MVFLFQLVLAFLLLTALILCAQFIFSTFLKRRLSPPEGLVGLLAVHEILVLPFLFGHFSLRIYMALFVTSIAVLVVVCALRTKSVPRLQLGDRPKALAVTLVCAAVLIGLGLAYQRPDADDSYYLGLASDAVAHDTINGRDPASGVLGYQLGSFYPLQGYELFISSLAIMSGLPVAIVAHIVIFAVIVLLSLLAYRRFFAELGLLPRFAELAIVVFSALLLTSGNSIYQIGNFILARAWQGKTILVAVFLPLLFSCLIKFHGRRLAPRDFVWLTAIAFASIAVNPVAIYLMPPVILAFRIFNVRLGKLYLPREISLLLAPYTAAAVVIRLSVSSFESMTDQLSKFGVGTWALLAKLFFGNWQSAALYVMAFALCFVLLHKRTQRLPLLVIVLIGVTILNPFLAGLVAHHITSVFTYWRLFWLLMAEFIIVLAVVASLQARNSLTNSTWRRLALAGAVGFTLVVLANRSFLLTPRHGFERTTNLYKLPDYLVKEAAHISNDTLVLAPTSTSTYLRILRPDLRLVCTRLDYMQSMLHNDPGKLSDYTLLFTTVEGERAPDTEFANLLRKYRVQQVVVDIHLKALDAYMRGRYAKTATVSSGTIYATKF